MQANILFHSVCGNTWIMATMLEKALQKQNVNVQIKRVPDADFAQWQEIFPVAQEFASSLEALPVAEPNDLVQTDLLFLGSPTYFGNMSGEMKSFLDGASIFWREAPLTGKKLGAFTSSGSLEGGASLCLQTLQWFGQHMGMLPLSVSPKIGNAYQQPAYGLVHSSGGMGDVRPNQQLQAAADAWIEDILS